MIITVPHRHFRAQRAIAGLPAGNSVIPLLCAGLPVVGLGSPASLQAGPLGLSTTLIRCWVLVTLFSANPLEGRLPTWRTMVARVYDSSRARRIRSSQSLYNLQERSLLGCEDPSQSLTRGRQRLRGVTKLRVQ
jgi:hypothetical protein